MSRFLERVPAASTAGLDLDHYRLVAGFLDSSRSSAPAEIIQDIRITCTSPASRDTLLRSLTEVVATVRAEASKPGGTADVLTYMAFASLDDNVCARIFGRWRTRDGLERFIRRGDVNGFWKENKENLRAKEQRLYVPNGKGWLHRGSGFAGVKGEKSML